MNFINRDLNSINKNEWETILKQGAFRGKKINRLAKSLSKSSSDLVFDSSHNRVYVNDNAKHHVDLIDIKRCSSPWTISRINHWISKNIFRKDQTRFNNEIKELAEEIYSKLHVSSSDAKIELDQLKKLSATELNDFLDAHPTEISRLALNDPKAWLLFSREIRTHLDDAPIIDRLDKLDQVITKYLGIESHYYVPFKNNQLTSVDEVNNKILDDGFVKYNDPKTYKRQISDSIELMKTLYKGVDSDEELILGAIRVQPFARFVNQNQIAISDLNLPFKDLERLIPYLNYLDLQVFKTGDHFSLDLLNRAKNVTTLIVNAGELDSVIASLPSKDNLITLEYSNFALAGFDIKSLALVKNLKNLSLEGYLIEDYSPLEQLKHLENLSLSVKKNNDYKFIQPLTTLKSLNICNVRNKDLNFLNPLINLEKLTLEGHKLNGDGMKNLSGPFPKMTYLDVSSTHIEKDIQLANKGIEGSDEILKTCKELQKIPFLSQLSVLKLNDDLTCSASDIQEILNPSDHWLSAPW